MVECRNCGFEIVWELKELRWLPMDSDGRCHFDTCPKKPKKPDYSGGYRPIDFTNTRLNIDDEQNQLNDFK